MEIVNEMVSDENALTVKVKDKKEMVLFKDQKIISTKMYEIVCDVDYTYPLGGKVYFKAKEPVKVNGLFAKKIVQQTRGKVYFIDKSLWQDSVASDSRDAEIAESKSEIADLKSQVEALIKLQSENKQPEAKVKNVVPKTKAKVASEE